MTLTVVSGGQDGADLAAWKSARQVGLSTAGWMPAGFLTENGPRLEYASLFNARETESRDYPERTRLNVKDSDATILFVSTRAKSHRGCDLTRKAAADLKKPILVIPVWATPDVAPPTVKLAGLIRDKGFKVVNIAGSRGSSDPGESGKPWTGIEGWVFGYLLDVFTLLKEMTP